MNNDPTGVQVILPDVPEENQSVRADFRKERLFGQDDYVVVKNPLDGQDNRPKGVFVFSWGKRNYRLQPGQVTQLPGYLADHYLIHMVNYCYNHIEKDPLKVRRAYARDDKYVKLIVQKVTTILQPSTNPDDNAIQDLPEYLHEDEHLSAAVGGFGGKSHELNAVNADEGSMREEDFDKIPDFDPRLNPNVPKEEVQPKEQPFSQVKNEASEPKAQKASSGKK